MEKPIKKTVSRQRIHQIENMSKGICGSCGKRVIHPESKCHCYPCIERRRARMRLKKGCNPGHKTGMGRKAFKRATNLLTQEDAQ